MSAFFSTLKHRLFSWIVSVVKCIAPILSDEIYTCLMYRLKVGHWLDLKNPTTFFEKIQWLKLYDHRSEYTIMADKFEMKKWVTERVGEGYVVPVLNVWNGVEEIDYDTLPDRFVLKTTHDNGGVVICKDKANFDRRDAEKKLSTHLKRDFYAYTKEWPYKHIPHRLLAEEYWEDDSGELIDYKVFCMGGTPYFTLVVCDRYKDMCYAVYDMDWKLQPFLFEGFRPCKDEVKRPQSLQEMVRIAQKLSEGLPFVRIDFYEVKGDVRVGELTLFPAAGFTKFVPDEYDALWGKLLPLDSVKK